MYELDFRVVTRDGAFGGKGTTFNLEAYLKGTDTPVTNEQIWDWFQRDLVLGVSVKLKPVWLAAAAQDKLDRPTFGVVTKVEGGTVYLGDEGIPSPLFHEWYTLD